MGAADPPVCCADSPLRRGAVGRDSLHGVGAASPPLNLPPGWGETFRTALRVDSCLRRNDGRGAGVTDGARPRRRAQYV